MRSTVTTPLPAFLAALAVLPACGSGGAGRADGNAPAELVEWSPDRSAFEPAQLRVHPLTRVTRDPDGAAVLACHIELRDATHQVVKCLGVARVRVRTGQAATPGDGAARAWELDLRDPLENAQAFDDVVTRTYALRLGSLPEELAKLADAHGSGASEAAYAVDVVFLFKDAPGDVRELHASGDLTGP
jgi:hypothetical protein